MSAPFYGGTDTRDILGNRFFVDGDFTTIGPCGPPCVRYPFTGDTIYSANGVATLLNSSGGLIYYISDPSTSGPTFNRDTWNPFQGNQSIITLEQDFMVALESYQPQRLNSSYYPAWSCGWAGTFSDNYASINLGALILVSEGEVESVGMGIGKVRRMYATFPNPRSLAAGVYPYQFIGLAGDGSGVGARTQDKFGPVAANARLHQTFFLFDYFNVHTAIPLISDDAGFRINNTTQFWRNSTWNGGLIIPAQKYVLGSLYLSTDILNDDISGPSTPSQTDYLTWITGDGQPGGLPVEICAQDSTFRQWLGNIWVRETIYILAQ